MSDVIAAYRAQVPAQHWGEIGDFVRALVTDYGPAETPEARYVLGRVTRLVHWGWMRGYPLDRQVLLRREVIAEFVTDALADQTKRTQATVRSKLFAVSGRLLTGPHRQVPVPELGIGPVRAPYTAAQVVSLCSWARNQNTQYRVVNASILLALGFGGGLTAREIAGVRAQDVTVDTEGVLVVVREGLSPRSVPLLAEWEADVAVVASASLRPDQYLLLPRRVQSYNRNLISNFTKATRNRPCAVVPAMMRTTWIVRHLAAGTPMTLLSRAAGMTSAASLGTYLAHVPDLDPIEGRRLMRSAERKQTRS